MSKKIYGVTVGTPLSPNKIDQVLNPVKSVNGKFPDKAGNVSVEQLGTASSHVDSSSSLIKHNPENVLPYAAVNEVGGMTRKGESLNELKSAKVTALKSVGALPYEPYKESTFPIPEAVQALDGYGDGVSDTVYNYVDFEKKQFVKNVGCVDLGMLSWVMSSSSTYRYQAEVPNIVSVTADTVDFVCDKYRGDTVWADKTASHYATRIYVFDSDYTDAASFKAAMSGVMLYYELAEPVITDISDILSHANMLEVYEGGTVEVVTDDAYAESVPTKITYYYGGNEIIGANTVIGDLIGTASRANASMKDGKGNVIDTFYAPAPIISQTDITAGTTPLATGQSYHVYE